MKLRNNTKLHITVIWFSVIFCGIAYAAINPVNVILPLANTPLAAGQAAALGNKLLTGILSGNANNGVGYNALGQIASSNTTTTNVTTNNTKYTQGVLLADGQHDTKKTGTSTASLSTGDYLERVTAARQADTLFFAAAVDSANAISTAIMQYYDQMTPEQALADYIAEMTSYGFLPANSTPEYSDKSAQFPLISKAWASIGKPSLTGLPVEKTTGNMNYNSKRGVGCNGGDQRSVSVGDATGCLELMDAKFDALPRKPRPSGPYTVELNTQWIEHLDDRAQRSGKVRLKSAKIAWYNRPSPSIKFTQNDRAGFFGINKAYAQSDTQSDLSPKVLPAIGQQSTLGIAACNSGLQAGEGVGTVCDSGTNVGFNLDLSSPFISKAYAASSTPPSAAEIDGMGGRSLCRDPTLLARQDAADVNDKHQDGDALRHCSEHVADQYRPE